MSNPTYDQMLDMNGPTIELLVARPATTQDRDGLGATISKAAMQSLTEQMTTWVGTRILRHQDATGLMPQTVTVTLTVNVEA